MNNRVFEIIHDTLVLRRDVVETVPSDEPVFVLRSRDCKALATIRAYQSNFSPTSEHWKIIQAVINDFTKFRNENPDKMGEPKECY